MKEYQQLIFESKIDPFAKRMWQIYSANFLFTLLLLVSAFFFKQFNGIVLVWCMIIIWTLVVEIHSSYKWSLNKVRLITLNDNIFTVVITRKNTDRAHLISKENISTKLKWESNKPKVLTLTIFDGATRIVKVYSGRQKNEYDLEDIAYQIKKQLARVD